MSPIGSWSQRPQSSLSTNRSVEISSSEPTRDNHERPESSTDQRSPRNESPSYTPHMGLWSNAISNDGNPMQEDAEVDPAMPVGDSSLNPRSRDINKGSCSGKKASDEKQSSESASGTEESSPHSEHAAPKNVSTAYWRKNFGCSMWERSRALAARLNPSSSWCDIDRAAAPRDVMESGEPRSDDPTASLEAYQLVRDLVDENTDQPPIIRRQSSSATRSGVRRRESEGGVLAQLLKLQGGSYLPLQEAALQKETIPEAETPGDPFGRSGPGKSNSWMGNFLRHDKPWYTSPNTPTGDDRWGGLGGNNPSASNEELSIDPKGKSQQSRRNQRLEDEIRVTVHIADIISRQRYIMQLCKALMKFGAPMHRLEEHMQMTATVLEVDSQFLYVPGCMIMSFDDPSTRTTEVKLVRVEQGINLGLLADTHDVYKNVIHDVIGVEEATGELENILSSKPRFNKWIVVIVYGIASAMVGPFAFNARPIDMPIIFLNGTLLGVLHHVIAPSSVLYSNVFEVTASILTSFIARGIGSIEWTTDKGNREYLFCFSAIAQSSIAMILPGYTVLSSSLELQSHQLVAGSIRMVYAIIYSLFLGYGITVGTTIYGLIDPAASSDLKCPTTGDFPDEYSPRFPFVAAFVICLLIVNQGRWKQLPMMLFIAEAGYVVTYFVTQRIGSSSQVANTIGAFTIGVIGNLYSRLWHGHAAISILPGIFVLVPSGLAASGPLLSGVKSAEETRGNVTSAIDHSGYSSYGVEDSQLYTADLGFGMVEVSIGITVGLFIAALLIYPFGKRRSGLFSF